MLRSLPYDRRARALDLLVLALLALPVLVAMAVIAVAIKLESPGPVFYRAARVGRYGRPFLMFKFRKMADGATGGALTSAHDDRFTRLGPILARTKLDELPQLINVALGDMRLVGPRPEAPEFVRHFPEEFARILSVRPGMTGPTQLLYFREYLLIPDGDKDEYLSSVLPRKLTSDVGYLEHRGLATDISVLLRTGVAVMTLGWIGAVQVGRNGARLAGHPMPAASISATFGFIALIAAGAA